jgi:hypothetical protein
MKGDRRGVRSGGFGALALGTNENESRTCPERVEMSQAFFEGLEAVESAGSSKVICIINLIKV